MKDPNFNLRPYTGPATPQLTAPFASQGWPAQADPDEAAESSLSISSVLQIARKNLIVGVVLVLLGSMAGFAAVIFSAPMYRARLMLELKVPARGPQQDQQEISSVDIYTNIQLIRSGAFLRRVMDRMRTETVPPTPVRTDFFSKLRARFIESSKDPVEIMNMGLARAVNTFDVRPINNTRLLEVMCESTHPEIAANFANTLAAEYIDQQVNFQSQQSQQSTTVNRNQLEETKAKLNAAEKRLQDFIKGSGSMYVAQDNNTLADTKLKDLQGELSSSQRDRITKQARYELVSKAPVEALGDVLNDTTLSGYQAKLVDLRREIAALLTTFTHDHPKVRRLEVQVKELEGAYTKEASAVQQRLKVDYEAAVRRERLLTSAYGAQAGQVSSQASQSTEYQALRRDVDTLAQMYNHILMQTSQSDLANAIPPSAIRLVDPAVPPEEPYAPKPAATIAFGTMAGMGLAVGIAFLREKLDGSVKGRGKVATLLRSRELGVIPSFHLNEGKKNGWPALLSGSSNAVVPAQIATNLDGTSHDLVKWHQESSALAESFRFLLASLLRPTPAGTYPKVVLFTSPGPGEGKTTVVSNLGIALAETHRRTLIIDADFRLPRVHKLFNVPTGVGLTDLLDTNIPLTADRLEKHLQPTVIPSLFILANGPEISNVSRVLYSAHFREVIALARQQFDFVLIDTAPILHVADARVIDHLTDGVVLVLRDSVTEEQSALRAYQHLREDGAVLLGTVLNDWKPAHGETQYSYYYGAGQR